MTAHSDIEEFTVDDIWTNSEKAFETVLGDRVRRGIEVPIECESARVPPRRHHPHII